MGHENIDSLKETPAALSQERVGKENLERNVWNGTDGLTDSISWEPMKRRKRMHE
jgi:hypothetical protein